MKKLIAMLLAVMMLVSFTACGNEEAPAADDTTATTTTTEPAPEAEPAPAPLDALTAIWEKYDENNKFFAMGGDYANMTDGVPGKVDVTTYDNFGTLLVCPAEAAAMIDDAASLIHSMNANTFTGAVYHLTDAANKDAFVTAMQDSINNNQWMCGFPETLYIASLDDSTIIVAFGNGEVVTTFINTVGTTFETASTIVEAPIG